MGEMDSLLEAKSLHVADALNLYAGELIELQEKL